MELGNIFNLLLILRSLEQVSSKVRKNIEIYILSDLKFNTLSNACNIKDYFESQ